MGWEPEWSETWWRSDQWPPISVVSSSKRAELLAMPCPPNSYLSIYSQSSQSSNVIFDQVVANSILWFKANFIDSMWSKYHSTSPNLNISRRIKCQLIVPLYKCIFKVWRVLWFEYAHSHQNWYLTLVPRAIMSLVRSLRGCLLLGGSALIKEFMSFCGKNK